MIEILSHAVQFPDPALAEPDGLLAIGGDLSVDRLRAAYSSGIFPWFSDDDPILWYSPHQRCVLFPHRVHVSRSMVRVIRSGRFQITRNADFYSVIRACAEIARKGETGTWITAEMQSAYVALHAAGFAESVEVWQDGELVGGMYGVIVNGVFCGESMFSRVSNASKMAIIWLCHNGGYRVIDCQMPTDHLMSIGAEMISRKEFLEILNLTDPDQ